MVTQSSILTREIPWAEEPGSSIGSQRVGHDLATKHRILIPNKRETNEQASGSPQLSVCTHFSDYSTGKGQTKDGGVTELR